MQGMARRVTEALLGAQVRLYRRLERLRPAAGEGHAGSRGGERGVSTAEYALLLALVVVVLITSLTTLGRALRDRITELTNTIVGAQ
jgi:Flp pilus assembly pilin Flp